MKKKNYRGFRMLFLVLPLALICLTALARDFYQIYTKDVGIIKIAGDRIDSVKVDNAIVNFYQTNSVTYTKALVQIDSIALVSSPVADLLDIAFKADGTAEDISPKKNVVTTLANTGLFTFFSNPYRQYVARFNNSDPGNTLTSGYYKVDYSTNTAFKEALADGHSLEAFFTLDIASPFPDKEIKVLSSHESGGTGLMIGANNRNNSIIFLPNINSAYVWANSGIKPLQGRYYHVVGVWNKSEGKAYIYVDGVLKNTQTAAGNFTFPNNSNFQWFGIGADPGNPAQAGWRGDIAIARVYDKPLTATDVERLWDSVKDLPSINEGDMITNISFLSPASVISNSNYTIQGNGFVAGDKIRLSSLTGVSNTFLCTGTASSASITFTLPETLVSGRYRMILVRGDKTQDLGFTTLDLVDFIPDPPRVIAHRGYWDVAGSAQNSIASLRKAQELGVYGSEFDVWITTDGKLVINHDENLTINGSSLRIDASTYAQIKDFTLSNGEKLPTLADYLSQGKKDPDTQLILEIKTHNTLAKNNAAVAAVVAMVNDSSMTDQVEYIAFDLNVCKELVRLQPGAKVAYLNGDLAPQTLHDLNITGIDYPIAALGNHLIWIQEAHNLGMSVNVWTVNSEAEMLQMKKQGVDYITTDKPVLANSLCPQQKPRFAVISDTHFENGFGEGAVVKIPRALKNLSSKTPLIDAIFVVGDLTDHGDEGQYTQFVSCFNNPANIPSEVGKYYLMGNHDNYSGAMAPNYYREKTGQELHQYVVIKNYPFITISQNGSNAYGDGMSDYNIEARNFLSEKLALARQTHPGKPIFVFVHVPPRNTCYGSSTNEGWGMTVLLPILNNYPEAIVFSGHSHFPLGDPRSIHQDKFTTINDGSSTYSEVENNVVDDGVHPQEYVNVTEGVIVNVLKNGDVEIERWDTYRNEEILPRWTVKAPHDGSKFTYKTRNGLPAPSFSDGIKPTVAYNEGLLSCTVTFPQATDNEAVFRYRIEILDGSNTVASYTKFSQFYLNSATPNPLSVLMSNLPPSKTLTARVKALDSYNNESAWIVSEPFVTDEMAVVTIPELNPTLYYSFEDPDHYATPTVGTSNLSFYDKTGNKTLGTLGNPPTGSIEGPFTGKTAVTIPKDKHVKVLNTTGTSDGGAKLNTYTLLYDIKFRTPNQWYALLQGDPTNSDGDADLFINTSNVVGLGGLGYSSEALQPNKWYRIVVILEGSNGSAYLKRKIYANGKLIHSFDGTHGSADKDGRYALGSEFCIFTDDDGEENDIDCAGFAFWGKRVLTPEEITLLGSINGN